jgi:hypothetical protein
MALTTFERQTAIVRDQEHQTSEIRRDAFQSATSKDVSPILPTSLNQTPQMSTQLDSLFSVYAGCYQKIS